MSVVVTGGSSGIGRAVVELFAADGFGVVVLDQRPPDGDLPDNVTTVVGDVTSAADNEAAVAAAIDSYGRLDVFVGNAGIHDGGLRLEDRSSDDLVAVARQVFEVDVLGYLRGAKAAAADLRESGGCMIFTLSDASFVVDGNGAGVGYVTAKHAGLGLVKHLAADLAPRVRVNAVAPGGTITGLRAVDPGGSDRPVFADADRIRHQVREFAPLELALSPEQIAPCYRFLASDAATGMTGEVLRPDGGLDVR